MPVGKVVRFPDSVVMSSDTAFSSIFTLTASQPGANDPDLPRGVQQKYRYVSFRFQPDGATNLSAKGQWFITVHLLNDKKLATAGQPPPNFFTWVIEPVSGVSKIIRPGVKTAN